MGYLESKVTTKVYIKKKREITYLVLKLIKTIQRDGKFTRFYNLFYKATMQAIRELKAKNGLKMTTFDFYYRVFVALSPFCDLKNFKASGRTVKVPAPFRFNRLVMTVVGFLVHGMFECQKKYGYTLQRALKTELLYAFREDSIGEAYQKKVDFTTHIFANEKHMRFLRSL